MPAEKSKELDTDGASERLKTQRQRENSRGRVFICLHFGVKHYTCDNLRVRSQVFDGEAKIFLTCETD